MHRHSLDHPHSVHHDAIAERCRCCAHPTVSKTCFQLAFHRADFNSVKLLLQYRNSQLDAQISAVKSILDGRELQHLYQKSGLPIKCSRMRFSAASFTDRLVLVSAQSCLLCIAMATVMVHENPTLDVISK